MEGNKKVLIVDDEEKARLYLASILSELYPGLEIQLSATPTEALFLLKKQHFDVLLLDVEMQGMTGLELVDELQKLTQQPPIIFVSAYKRAEFIQKAIRLNAVDYIDKPVNPTELDNAIKKAFEITKKILKEPDTSASVNKRFCLLTDIDKRFVEADEILYFQSSKRYSQVHFVDGNKRIVRYSLVHLKKNLPSGHFIHVSRQFIINIKYLKKISKSNKNITLQYCNTEIKLGKIFPVVLTELIKKYSLKV